MTQSEREELKKAKREFKINSNLNQQHVLKTRISAVEVFQKKWGNRPFNAKKESPLKINLMK